MSWPHLYLHTNVNGSNACFTFGMEALGSLYIELDVIQNPENIPQSF